MSSDNGPPALLIVLSFALVFPAFWVLITYVLSHASGWRVLARNYPAEKPPSGQRMLWQSGRMRMVNLNRVLNVVADQRGLHLSMMRIFAVGSKPFYVPWSEVTAFQKRHWFRNMVVLKFTKAPGVSLQIYPRLASKLEALSGGAFRVAPATPV